MTSIQRSFLVGILAALVAAPVAASTSGPERTRPTAFEGSSATWCGDVEPVTADPERYRDSPVYVWGNPDVRTVQRWAKKKPGYQDLWLDDDNLGWIALGFTEGADERQAQLERRFPDIGAVAVEVEWTRKELRRLQRRVGDELFGEIVRSGSISVDFGKGMVELTVGEVTGELLAAVEAAFAGEPVCVVGPDPSELPPPGPQATAGDGWSLLGHQDKPGPPWYRTGIATKPGQLASLWAKAEMPGDPPAVDFVEDVVLWFADPHGSSCTNQRLDGVVVDEERSIIWPDVVWPDHPVVCTADLAGAHHFFVALERDRLPAPPFWIQLGADDPPGGAPKERTVVEVDLQIPGSITEKGDAHFDREMQKATPLPQRSGTSMQPRGKSRYAFDATCGIGYLGRINDIHWVTEKQQIPAEWAEAIDMDGEIIVTVRLRGEPDPHVTATANGHSLRYEPVRNAPEVCES